MMDKAQAIARLDAAQVPKGVMHVIETLQSKGHQAVLVGGCVRDCLLVRKLKDWDLATSAQPKQVQKAFRKTIPTGIEHGTVTVLPPVGPKTPVEVTTFRGDEGYEDGRHPDSVRFLTNLDEDLARRDFTINAMAYDPVARVFSDPFAGLEDLNQRQIRAVGEAQVRFEEDGLRTMRALRFAATLGFALEASTAEALEPCAPVLAKVSRERVRVELAKMLGAQRPTASLTWMWRSGIWDIVLGAQSRPQDQASLEELLSRVEKLPGEPWMLRLAGLLWPQREDRTYVSSVIDELRPSRQERRAALVWLGEHSGQLHAAGENALALRRAYVALTPEFAEGAVALAGWSPTQRERFDQAIRGAPSGLGDLKIGAKELIAEGLLAPGPQLGECLRALLDWVLQDLSRNDAAQLLDQAKRWTRELDQPE